MKLLRAAEKPRNTVAEKRKALKPRNPSFPCTLKGRVTVGYPGARKRHILSFIPMVGIGVICGLVEAVV